METEELMLRGNMIDAEECSKIGLLQHLIKTDLLSSFIDDICREIVANGTSALRLQKQLILEWEERCLQIQLPPVLVIFKRILNLKNVLGSREKFSKKLLTEFFVKVDHYLTGFHK